MKFGTKRFSIRTLLIATFIVCVVLAMPVSKALKQKRGRKWVESQRGHVSFEFEYDYKNGKYTIPNVPNSLVQLLGVDLFNSVTGVIFDCDPIVDFEPVTDLRALRSIFVNIEMAEDIDFSPLADLGELKEVHFSAHSLITRQQFKSLKTLLPHVNVTAEMYTDKS